MIWNKETKNNLITTLAPMEGVTDFVFRDVVNKAGAPDIFFTEFANADGWMAAGNKAVNQRLLINGFEVEEQNTIAQIWGKSPEAFATFSKHCASLGFAGIDINTGCPDKTVIKNGCGSALIDDWALMEKLVEASRESSLPVSVKTRLGTNEINISGWINFLLNLKLPALIIHLRTRKEMSKVGAHFECIDEIARLRDRVSPETKLIMNGDILTVSQGLELQKKSAFDGIMVGRGIFQNIFCFADDPDHYDSSDRLDMFLHHIDLLKKKGISESKLNDFKKFYKIYIKGFDGASEVRLSLMKINTIDELLERVKEMRADNGIRTRDLRLGKATL